MTWLACSHKAENPVVVASLERCSAYVNICIQIFYNNIVLNYTLSLYVIMLKLITRYESHTLSFLHQTAYHSIHNCLLYLLKLEYL